MDFLQLTRNWTEGEITQAKFMIILGCFTTVISFSLIMSSQELNHGIAIPLTILALIYIFYGAFIFQNRPNKLNSIIKSFKDHPKTTLEAERQRILTEKASYKKVRITWFFVFLIGLITYFLVSTTFHKGIAIGIAIIGGATFLIDTLLLTRINRYYSDINNLISKKK